MLTLRLFVFPVIHQHPSFGYTVDKGVPLSYGQHDLAIGSVYPIELPYVSVRASGKHPSQIRRCCDGVYGRAMRRSNGWHDIVYSRRESFWSHTGPKSNGSGRSSSP